MLGAVLFHLSALFSVQLIALTFAIFLFIYIKKQDLAKWYTFVAITIVGLVILMMLATFIGIIVMATRPHGRQGDEGERFDRREMRHHWRGRHEGYRHERHRDWEENNKEEDGDGRDERGDRGGRDFHHGWFGHHGSEDGTTYEDKRIEIKDSIVKNKFAPKK